MQGSGKVYDSLHTLERGRRYRAFDPMTNDTLWMARLRLVGVNADFGIIERREEVDRYFAVTGWHAERGVRPLYKLVDPNELQVDIPPRPSNKGEAAVVAEALMADYAWASPSRLNVWAHAVACTHGWYLATVSNAQRLPVPCATARFFRDAEAVRAIRGLLETAGLLCRHEPCAQP